MQAMTRWWWIRHATVGDPTSYMSDEVALQAPLDEDSMEILASILPKDSIWLASPERRTFETSRLLQAKMLQTGTEVALLDSFRDQNFGDWAGQPILNIAANNKYKDMDAADIVPEQGESFKQVFTRVSAAIDTIHQGMEGAETVHIIAVAHASTVRAALMHALQLTASNALHIHINPLSLTCLDYYAKPAGWMVRAQNWSVIPKL